MALINTLFGQAAAAIAASRKTAVEVKKLESFFQPGRVLQGIEGRVYRVLNSKMCTVFLMDNRGQEYELSWLKPNGEVRKDILERFTPIGK